MRRTPMRGDVTNPLMRSRNWEENIRNVVVEPCHADEDPTGYKAIFYLTLEAATKTKKRSFEIGGSFLAQRHHNLNKAGYKAPMTVKAIEDIEDKIGRTLPILLGGISGAGASGFATA